jgi:hypothetical protein
MVRELQVHEEDVYAEFVKRDWCDGLPIVAPTPERVRAMIAGAHEDPQRVLGLMPPLWRQASIEKLAVNAVMAGCEPAYFPVIVAAVKAVLDPAFNLYGVRQLPIRWLRSSSSAALAAAIGMYRLASFGLGFRANATRPRPPLILLNGRRMAGRHDTSTRSPGCPPTPSPSGRTAPGRRARAPASPEQSVVRLRREGPPTSTIVRSLPRASSTMSRRRDQPRLQCRLVDVAGAAPVVLGPEQAQTIVADGLTAADVQRFVRARAPASGTSQAGRQGHARLAS